VSSEPGQEPRRRRRLRVAFGLSVAANLAFLAFVLFGWTNVRRVISRGMEPLRAWVRDTTGLDAIVAHVRETGPASPTARIDFVRTYVYSHSVHKIDAEHDDYAFDTPRVLAMLVAHQQDGAALPHLSCGPRAFAMREILEGLGISSRLVSVFSDDFDDFPSHTFLDVLNTETGRWEVQDPDRNVYYMDDSGQRVGTLRLVLGDLSTVTPHSADASGWAATGMTRLRDHWFEALLFFGRNASEESVLVQNTQRLQAEGFASAMAERYAHSLALVEHSGWGPVAPKGR
jgi:hypothetical protein